MKKVLGIALFCVVAQTSAVVSFADAPLQSIPLNPGESLIEQLMDGRLVQFTCGVQQTQPTPSQPQPTECVATLTVALPGYIGSQPTQDVNVVGDSPKSKYEALQNLRGNCIVALAQMNVSNATQACEGLSEGNEITCRAL